MEQRPSQAPRAEQHGPLLRAVERLGAHTFTGERPLATLLRLYVAVNVAALAIALVLGGPGGHAQAAADSVWAWCRIG